MTIQEIKEKMKKHSITDKAMRMNLGINPGDWSNYISEKKHFPEGRGLAAKYFFKELEKCG